MNRRECDGHVTGQSLYVEDIPLPAHSLHAAVVVSPIAHGRLHRIDSAAALAMPGVVRVLTAQDIPGDNQVGDIVPDERLLAVDHLNFIGKPVALVLAETAAQARAAAAQVQLDYTELPAILDVTQAYEQGHTFGPPRQLVKGDPAQAFQQAHWIAEGQVETPAQEHLYFETQAALAIPQDGDRLHLYCTSQNPSGIQRFAARVLNRPMHTIHVEVPRLGGAFGGKEEQTKPWALLAALGAVVSGRPVRLVLNRQEDMHWTGKRHPYRIHYRLGADADGRLLAYDVLFLQDGGAVADLSTAVLERTLFHATNAYAITHTDIRAVSCRTHHPSNTAFRGFGAPQAILALECALDQLSRISGRPRWQLQATNLVAQGYAFPYGMRLGNDSVRACWQHLWDSRRIQARLHAIEQHNQREPRQRRALALTPLCFGIAFTATHLNQGCATVNVYTDGSIGIAISAVEMGQGLIEKVRAIAARCFALPLARIRVDFTHTARTPNMPPTAASVGTDLCGIATLRACTDLRERLRAFAATRLAVDVDCIEVQAGLFRASNAHTRAIPWDELVEAAYLARLSLQAQHFHATPELYFDRQRGQGHPFAYHVCGTSAIEVELDSLLGTYRILQADVVYDLGESLDPQVDRGQMEGGLVQGIGYTTLEEVIWDNTGHLLTDRFATYKIPDLLSSPRIHVEFINSGAQPSGPFNAKAIGEPPLLLGLGAGLALLEALRTCAPDDKPDYCFPVTPERLLLALYPALAAQLMRDFSEPTQPA